MHVEVVEKHPLRLRLHDNESDPLTIDLAVVSALGDESREKALPCVNGGKLPMFSRLACIASTHRLTSGSTSLN